MRLLARKIVFRSRQRARSGSMGSARHPGTRPVRGWACRRSMAVTASGWSRRGRWPTRGSAGSATCFVRWAGRWLPWSLCQVPGLMETSNSR
jgi:hypothetical protein